MPSENTRRYACAVALSIAGIVVFIAPDFRYAVVYNFLPLCFIGAAVLVFYRRTIHRSPRWTLTLLIGAALFFHGYNLVRFGVVPEFDSNEYLSLARSFATGHGLAGTVYRPPLYPVLVGLFMIAGDKSGLAVVVLQHILLVLSVPGIYYCGRLFGFSREASLIASAFMTLNSLLMQSAGFIMTEIVFLFLVLACIAALKRLYIVPSIGRALVAGLLFAAASYCRQLLFPVLLCGCAALVWKKGKGGILAASVSMIVFFGATAPWCLRNLFLNGHYAMSASFGVQAFTKATAFHLEDAGGRCFKRIEKPLGNVLVDMGRSSSYAVPVIPEDDWQINRAPHVLIDTLMQYHGYSYFGASNALGKAATEGFLRRPVRYLSSIFSSFCTLLFSHREMYPNAGFLAPVDRVRMPPAVTRIIKGMVYISGYVFLLFPVAAVLRRDFSFSLWAPFAAVCMMYFFTAAIQIGFTRYTIPWEPLKVLCAAYTVETALRWAIGCFTRRNRLTT
jgi:Dolichyl-phosphate-mannose-protein mannosyltransferase